METKELVSTETILNFLHNAVEKKEVLPPTRWVDASMRLAVLIGGKNIAEITGLPSAEAYLFFHDIIARDGKKDLKTLSPLLKEIEERLDFLRQVGLEYLTLDRSSTTLSGGEAQRVRLATQIGSSLTGVLYVLDELFLSR